MRYGHTSVPFGLVRHSTNVYNAKTYDGGSRAINGLGGI